MFLYQQIKENKGDIYITKVVLISESKDKE